MSENRFLSLHYFVRTFILLGFSSYIVFLSKSGALGYYIAPRMMIYVQASAVVLYIVSCYQGYMALRAYWGNRVVCDCEHTPSRSVMRNGIAYSLFILPLLVGFLLPNTAMSSALAGKKGMSLTGSSSNRVISSAAKPTPSSKPSPSPSSSPSASPSSGLSAAESSKPTAAPTADPKMTQDQPAKSSSSTKTEAELDKMFKPADKWDEELASLAKELYKKDKIVVKPEIYLEVLSAIDLFKEPFIGKKIEISGFVYRENDLKENQFVVGRFVMQCCSADASPYGVLIDFPSAKNYTKDTWVTVSGTIQKTTYHNNEIFMIQANKVEKIPAPESVYVYPNFDPLSEVNK
jgi:putative membrane protein